MATSAKSVRRAFTLVELLVVIAVIGILVGMLFPAIQAVRGAARRSSCLNNLRNIVLAAHNYEATNQAFPKADDGEGSSLFVELTTFLDQQFLYERSLEDLGPSETRADRLRELSDIPFETLFCPATPEQFQKANVTTPDQGEFTTHYYGVAGLLGSGNSSDGTRTYTYKELDLAVDPTGGPVSLNGIFSPDAEGRFSLARGLQDIRDGASNTIMFSEVSQSPDLTGTTTDRGGWAFGAEYKTGSGEQPMEKFYSAKSISENINGTTNTDVNELAFGSTHNGGANVSFADGSTRFLRDRLSLDILKTIASIDRLETPERLEE